MIIRDRQDNPWARWLPLLQRIPKIVFWFMIFFFLCLSLLNLYYEFFL